MIYVIGLIVIAAIALIVWGNKKNSCKCDKCNEENCKCDANKCEDDCKCHDEAPAPYLNGHSKKVTAEPEACDHTACDCPTEPAVEIVPDVLPDNAGDEPKTDDAPEADEPKEEPKKEQPKKKPAKKNPAKKPDPKKGPNKNKKK